jgi:cysteine desulfurase
MQSVLELSRKSIAKQLNASAQEIILRLVERVTIGSSFCCADLKVKVITSKIEHHAVLYTVQALQKEFDSGRLCYSQAKWRNRYHNLVELLAQNHKTSGCACQQRNRNRFELNKSCL